MTAPASVILIATPDYGVWRARCPACRGTWDETTHDLYNVVSLPCPYCGEMLAVEEGDFHKVRARAYPTRERGGVIWAYGDDNAREVV